MCCGTAGELFLKLASLKGKCPSFFPEESKERNTVTTEEKAITMGTF